MGSRCRVPRHAAPTQTRTAIQTQINEVDAIIHDIRTAVFALNPTRPKQTPTEHMPDPDPTA